MKLLNGIAVLKCQGMGKGFIWQAEYIFAGEVLCAEKTKKEGAGEGIRGSMKNTSIGQKLGGEP
ncbi:MAG: hypothetical protein RR296_05505 [Clostridia bacterium]